MKIVVPQRIEPEAAALGYSGEFCVLGFVFPDNEGDGADSGLAHLADNGSEYVVVRTVEDSLSCIDPQSVQMIFVDPVGSIGEKELA